MAADAISALSDISRELALQALDLGLLEAEKYAAVKNTSLAYGEDIFSQLVAEKAIDEHVLLEKLSRKYGRPYVVDFKPYEPTGKFPRKYCTQNGLLPLVLDGSDVVSIGIAAPGSLNALKNFNLLAGARAAAYFIPFTQLKRDILEFEAFQEGTVAAGDSAVYVSSQTSTDTNFAQPTARRTPLKVVKPVDEEEGEDNLGQADGDAGISSSDVIKGLNEIFDRAIDQDVSDIHIERFRNEARIRFRKNGSLFVPKDLQAFVSKNYAAVISRIKIIAGLDIAERRLPQDGGANVTSTKSKTDVDLRISIIPTSFGERAVLRILRKSSLSLDIHALGFSHDQEIIFKRAIESPQGLVLVTGPTGSGKSTTLYGAINYLNKDDVNILTVEDPVEYTIKGISQVQIREEIGLTFASALRSFLRQDPEIVLVGEIRDQLTADIATKAALTGHLVMSTLHTNSAIGAITRLINMGLPRYLVSNALTCVVAQRLIRVNCKHCEDSYQDADIEAIRSSPLFPRLDTKRLRKGRGCDKCNMTGFSSRKAVHEVLELTPAIKAMIDADKSENEIFDFASKHGFVPMIERGLEFVMSGETSFEELLRSVPVD